MVDIVTTNEALAALCTELRKDTYVAIDTEFMRERTYWPELCLIQLAGARREAIIDPFATGLDLAPFFALMADESVLKVFHAARQDIEIFVYRAGQVPHPVFDTQVAAMVCGFGDQVGYEAIVRKLTGGHIDKSSRFTDWSQRPLSQKQLTYALSDVTHLRKVYEKLKALLEKNGRISWIAEEMKVLTSPATYRLDPDEAWRRLKVRLKSKKQLAVLMSVARWREREAQTKNVPRARVIKDDAVAEIAVQVPQSREALNGLRALPKGFANSRTGDAILEAVKAGLAMDQSKLPQIDHGFEEMTESAQAAAELLRLALKIVCAHEGIAPKLVASSDDLAAIAIDEQANVPAMHGWRRELFGRVALDIKAGRAMIGFADGRAAIVASTAELSKAAE
jgi:ribonuclease D